MRKKWIVLAPLAIVGLAGHRRLSRQYGLVEGQIRMFIASSNALLPTQQDVIGQHAPLVEAIGRGDAEAAEREMRGHIDSEGRGLIGRVRGVMSDE